MAVYVKVHFYDPPDFLLPRSSGRVPELFFFEEEIAFPEHPRRPSKRRMNTSPVVVEDLVVDGFDRLLERREIRQVPRFQLELPEIRLLLPILSWRGFRAHRRRADSGFREEIEDEEAPVLASLVAMEDFGFRPGPPDGVADGFENEFLRVDERHGMPDDFPGIRVQYGREVEREAFPY